MYIRWNASKKMTQENADLVGFAKAVIAELDRIFEQDTGIILKDIRLCQAGALDSEPTIWFPPANLELISKEGFYETTIFWDGPHNPKGFLAILYVSVHEYSHTLFHRWGYRKKGIKPHAHQFYDICRHVTSRLDFNSLLESWQESQFVEW